MGGLGSVKWRLLVQEASLSEQSIGIGLSYMRKANADHPGFYYGAFFNYTIGLERLMKLVMLVEHRVRVGEFPGSTDFKRTYGHDLEKLFESVRAVRESAEQSNFQYELPSSPLVAVAMSALADFAKFDRYHGLDVLTGSPKAKPLDPVARWFEEIGRPFLAGRSQRHAQRDEEEGRLLDALLGPFSHITAFSETGDRISAPGGLLVSKRESEYVAKNGTFLCAAIVRYIVEVLYFLHLEAFRRGIGEIPWFADAFTVFYNDDRYLKARKTFHG
ncbi:hypothetical protein ACFU7Z_10655 [Kitasatospora sp. NPDC057518]|uniref:hypothetical protein n=1 Tax=Kitasatospora sp. NPDC057518 TaxID=3346155 RepID=UPI0036BC360B